MIRPAAKHGLEVLAGLMSIVILGGTIFATELVSGPVSLRFLAPTLASYLTGASGKYRINVGDAVMRWSESQHAIELKIVGVDFFDKSGARVAEIPEMDVGLVMIGWKGGVIAPTRVKLDHVSAIVERDATGAFSIGEPSQGSATSALSVILNDLVSSHTKGTRLGSLTEVSLNDADLTLIDHRTGAIIRAPGARLLFDQTATGFHTHMEAHAEIADERSNVTLDGDYDSRAGQGTIAVRFTPVRLSHLASISDFYADLAPFDVGVGGTAHLSLGANARIERAELSLAAATGTFRPAHGDPVAVQSASFDGTYWPQSGRISIDWLKFEASGSHGDFKGDVDLKTVESGALKVTGAGVDLQGDHLELTWPARFAAPLLVDSMSLKGRIDFGPAWRADIQSASIQSKGAHVDLAGAVSAGAGTGAPALFLDGRLENLEVGDLEKIWPLGLADHAHTWIANHVHAGTVTTATLHLDAPAGAFAKRPLDESVYRIAFHLEDGVCEYEPGMPPLTDTSGDGTLTPKTLALDIAHAKVLASDITGGHVEIADLGVKGSPIAITSKGEGDVGDLLRVIDSPPLALLSKYGMTPDDFGGHAKFDLTLTIPEQSSFSVGEIDYRVVASGEDVKVSNLWRGLVLTHGTADVTVDRKMLDASGKFTLNGAPADIAWHDSFGGQGAMPSQFHVKTTLDDEARAALGLGAGSYVLGPVGVDATLRGQGKEIRQLSGKLDLTAATIDLDPYEWTKAAGIAASAGFDIAIAKSGAVTVKSVTATGRGIDIAGKASLAADGRLMSADFPRLKLKGFSDIALDIDRQPSEGLVARVDGAELNIGPILKQAIESPPQEGKLAWRVDADLTHATMRGGVGVDGLSAAIAANGKTLTAFDAKGSFEPAGQFSADLGQGADGGRLLLVSSSDAGKLIGGITGIQSFLGGHLTLNMSLEPGAKPAATALPDPPAVPTSPADMSNPPDAISPPQEEAHGGTSGMLKMDDFRIVNAPILARLLTVGSLQGIGDLLNGEGIEFTHLTMPFWMDKGRLGIDDGRASGPAIGITLQGIIDRPKKLTDLNGTIVPAYSLNSVLGNVPIVGPLLVSRPGEGIFGFTYNVAGGIADPKIVVNPLSALAPGFLRRLFELGDTEAGDLHQGPAPPRAGP